MNRFRHYLLLTCLLISIQANADFVVEDIRVEGLQRISAGTVFNYLPIGVGSTIRQEDYPEIIRALFQTGFFTDVNLKRDGDVLVVEVTERPAIGEITITGNRDIATEDLQKALNEIGLAEGRVFDRFLLEKMEQELLRQYFSRGKYAVQIDTEVRPLERNRVAIALAISEGAVARIRQINIVGNQDFTDRELLRQFQLSTTGWFTFLTRADQYSRERLAADIENLRSFYLDRGYLEFNVDSTQVSITPDRQDIYITINITEGDRYTIRDVQLAGELVVPEEELRALITVKPGDTFSRSAMTETIEQMTDRLGDEGYAFANVNTVPELDESARQVMLNFVVDPGRRVYVRRINFKGNIKTHDEVLRREMRQTEGGWFSTRDVRRSVTRLERLTYLENANVETVAVPPATDQVDLVIAVEERPSGNVTLGGGFGQDSGFLFNAGISQANFLGTGNQVNFNFSNSRINRVFNLAYNNPYYTLDGVSRGFRVFFREIDAGEANVADYVFDTYGGEVNFGIPVDELDFLRLGIGFEHLQIKTTDVTPIEIFAFLDDKGDSFNNFKLQSSWSNDSRNRVIFADHGALNRLSAELTVPGSDLEYYKLGYNHLSFLPLMDSLILSFRGELGYGDGYGDEDALPFFENFFVGGLRTIRGFKSNTLGPRFSNDKPSGGAFKAVGGGELIFPVPFIQDARGLRLAAFVDVGNVFASTDDFEIGDLRYSTGIAAQWLSPLGPIVLSVAAPLNKKAEDETEIFQFSLGVPF